MSSLAELREAVAEAVAGVGDPPLIGYAYAPGSPTVPCGVVEPEEVDFAGKDGATFRRGGEEWTLTVTVLIASVDEQTADRQRDGFFDRSGGDLKNAIEAIDPHRYEVRTADRWGEYGPFDNGALYAGFRLNIAVLN